MQTEAATRVVAEHDEDGNGSRLYHNARPVDELADGKQVVVTPNENAQISIRQYVWNARGRVD
jgi:hypothetical protein